MESTISWLLVTACVTALDARAQSQAASRQVFEVTSVRRCQNATSPTIGAPSPGRLNLGCVTTANLIRLAYLVFPTGQPNAPVSPSVFQRPISGGPAWINSERYTIDAKTESSVNAEMIEGPMMQALLEDRFKLTLHRETKKTDIFEITVAKGGPKLQPAVEGGCVEYDRNHPPREPAPGQPDPVLCGSPRKSASGGFDFPRVTMADLA
jgi:uncharacterized protein (TIGR03435 family)